MWRIIDITTKIPQKQVVVLQLLQKCYNYNISRVTILPHCNIKINYDKWICMDIKYKTLNMVHQCMINGMYFFLIIFLFCLKKIKKNILLLFYRLLCVIMCQDICIYCYYYYRYWCIKCGIYKKSKKNNYFVYIKNDYYIDIVCILYEIFGKTDFFKKKEKKKKKNLSYFGDICHYQVMHGSILIVE